MKLTVIGQGGARLALLRTKEAAQLFQHLGENGILVRRFTEHPSWLRFGLPGGEAEWERLRKSMASRPLTLFESGG